MAAHRQPRIKAGKREPSGSDDLAGQILQAYSKNTAAFEAQRERLTRQYPHQWVSFHDGKVITADTALERVIDAALEQSVLNVAVVEYLTDEPDDFVLPA